MKNRLVFLASIVAALAMSGCGGSGSSSGGGQRFTVLTMGAGDGTNNYEILTFRLNDRSADSRQEFTDDGVFAGLAQRPATGDFYAYDPATRVLARVDTEVGEFAAIGTVSSSVPNEFTPIDFNPVADRIRAISGPGGESFRINPDNAALAGTDTSLNPFIFTTNVSYTNSFSGATVTTLYAIEQGKGFAELHRIGGVDGDPSPNGGVTTSIGDLGLNFPEFVAGFDIAADGTAYVLVQSGDDFTLNTIDLSTGALTEVGSVTNINLDNVVGFSANDQS